MPIRRELPVNTGQKGKDGVPPFGEWDLWFVLALVMVALWFWKIHLNEIKNAIRADYSAIVTEWNIWNGR